MRNNGVGGVPDMLKTDISNSVLNLVHLENWLSLSKYTIVLTLTINSIEIKSVKETR